MKLSNTDQKIQVVEPGWTAESVIRSIIGSGVQENAFYVFDIGEVYRRYKEFVSLMPRVQPFYAVKCNDHPTILKLLADLGAGFDCASKGEINKILGMGVEPSNIIFANPAKPASHLRHAASTGVDLMTFDNEMELTKVKALHPSAKLVLRIRCDAEVAQCNLGMKFGCDAQTEGPRLIRAARFLGLDVVGVSFHVGSGCGDPPVFRRAILAARQLFNYAATVGYRFRLLDLGGGFPGVKGSSLHEIAGVVNGALDDWFGDGDVQVIAEPGRYFVASAFTLATCVHSKREVRGAGDKDAAVSHFMYYINEGVYGAFNVVLYDHFHPTAVPLKGCSGKMTPSSVWGPTCDSMDLVLEDVLLPALDVGDWLMFESMGAYTLVASTTFNGFPTSKVHIIVGESDWLQMSAELPVSHDQFVFGSSASALRLGLDAGDEDEAWGPPPRLPPPLSCHADAPPPPFLRDLVAVEPIN
ncbi:antizyme inhibitor 2-like [Bacillus rossius redtenbacheri]|uniref:antizyme inhibitor 2-like n=1 Tax=Bacillus rossius redtenbacheri TaxID=93214 RepID=UPI002FDD8A6A